MSRNIKEIGKELMGKSLNSFHRKTGLTQLEENNKMQDGILDGILSQVDDAYIEKTEQSNVIHLEGSGDGVVVLDSIEGNTMVNLFKGFDVYKSSGFKIISKTKLKMIGNGSYPTIYYKDYILKPNTKYTLIVNVDKLDISNKNNEWVILRVGEEGNTNAVVNNPTKTGLFIQPFTTPNVEQINNLETYMRPNMTSDDIIELSNMVILEGDWTNKEIPPYFEGLQSSFEEKVNDEGKYEIEILSNNRNLIDLYDENLLLEKDSNFKINNSNSCTVQSNREGWLSIYRIPVKKGKSYTLSANLSNGVDYPIRINDKEMTDGTRVWEINLGFLNGSGYKSRTFVATKDFVNILFYKGSTQPNCDITNIMLTPNDTNISFENKKSNKIKLLINEPLRATNTVKDKMCIKDNRLVVERNCGEVIFNGEEYWKDDWQVSDNNESMYFYLTYEGFGQCAKHPTRTETVNILSDYFSDAKCHSFVWGFTKDKVAVHNENNIYYFQVSLLKSKLNSLNVQGFKEFIKSNNGLKFVYKLAEPYYEEVTNEYGEPILLEGYENGTLYIDSTIVPTTTVRYTPKMESFKTLKEVEINNIMLTNDVNDNIIPYMMDVDMMILEKEMALMSHQYKLRRIGEKDMTSMQKRTQDMLERLIKGKTLTEQECKTRVTTYLNAGKITDAQAEELMLLISEVYA